MCDREQADPWELYISHSVPRISIIDASTYFRFYNIALLVDIHYDSGLYFRLVCVFVLSWSDSQRVCLNVICV